MNNVTSERFCQTCEKMTTFTYNKNIGHSECTVCGSRFALRKIPEGFIPEKDKQPATRVYDSKDLIVYCHKKNKASVNKYSVITKNLLTKEQLIKKLHMIIKNLKKYPKRGVMYDL